LMAKKSPRVFSSFLPTFDAKALTDDNYNSPLTTIIFPG